jgi:hypothetical protein
MTDVKKEETKIEYKSFCAPVSSDGQKDIFEISTYENNFNLKFYEKLTEENLFAINNHEENNLNEILESAENSKVEVILTTNTKISKKNANKNFKKQQTKAKNKLNSKKNLLESKDVKSINVDEVNQINDNSYSKKEKINSCNDKKRKEKSKSKKLDENSNCKENDKDYAKRIKENLNPLDNFLDNYNNNNQNNNVKINILINQNKSVNYFPINKDLFLKDFSLKKPEDMHDQNLNYKKEALDLISKIDLKKLKNFNYGENAFIRSNEKFFSNKNLKNDIYIQNLSNANNKFYNNNYYASNLIRNNINKRNEKDLEPKPMQSFLCDQEPILPESINFEFNAPKENFHTQLAVSNKTINKGDIRNTDNVQNVSNGRTKCKALFILLCLIFTSLLMIGISILVVLIQINSENKTFPLGAGDKNIYELLSSFKIECPKKQVLQSFWLHKNNEDLFQFKYKCSILESKLDTKNSYLIMNSFTSVDRAGDINNLSKQEVKCSGNDGLQGFSLIYNKIENKIAYNYKCVAFEEERKNQNNNGNNNFINSAISGEVDKDNSFNCQKTTTFYNPLGNESDPFEDLNQLKVEKIGFKFINGFKLNSVNKKGIMYVLYEIWVCN